MMIKILSTILISMLLLTACDLGRELASSTSTIQMLPPAKLLSWDGKIAIQRFEEGPVPAKPSDELVRRLAQQAGLAPNTGLPK